MAVLRTDINSDTDIQRSTAASAPLWTPADLGAALAEWWNADDTADGAVATWTGRKLAIAATAVAGTQPISAGNSLNSSYRGLTGDGVDDCLNLATLTGLPVGATAGECWGVFSFNLPGSTGGQNNIFRYGSTGATSRGLLRASVSSVSRAQTSDGVTVLTDTVIDLSGPHIVGWNVSGTTVGGRIDGRDTVPATATFATLATSTARGRIFSGSAGSPGSWFPGVIRHIIVTTLLTTTERDKLEGWFAWDSGLAGNLPPGHPYKSARP